MPENTIILAIAGLPGAGKSQATQYLVQKTGWPKIHFGDITQEGLKSQGLEINEENERKFREQLRAEHGMAAYALMNLPKIKSIYPSSNLIIESFYSWEEYLLIKKQFGDNFKVLAIFSSPQTRKQRLQNRPERPLTAEEFESRDISQIENLHQAGPIARADFMVINEGEVQALYEQIDKVINKINL